MAKKSIQYPSKTLFETKDFTLSVYEGHGAELPLEYPDLSKYGKVPIREVAAFASTASQYEWTTVVWGKGHKPKGDVCKAMKNPHPGEMESIYKEAFTKPDIYKHIIKDWNGKENVLEASIVTYLQRNFDFSDKGGAICAAVFIQNAKGLGLIDDSNTFRIDVEVNITEPEVKEKKVKEPKDPATEVKAKKKAQIETVTFKQSPNANGNPPPGTKNITVWIRSKKLVVPVLEDMTVEDWEAFIGQLQEKKN